MKFKAMISLLFISHSFATHISCEILDMGKGNKAQKQLIINSKEGQKYSAQIQSTIEVSGKTILKNTELSPHDHLTPKLITPEKIQLKLIKRVHGKNIQLFVHVDKNTKKGILRKQNKKYSLSQCEID